MNERFSHSRRQWMRTATASLATATTSGWLPGLAAAARAASQPGRHCVLLWMSGGPSQIDTFDMKPSHAHGGSIQERQTCVPGIRFSEHFPQLAEQADSMAILRGMSTKEGDHQRGTTLMRTGHVPGMAVRYPSIGCTLAKSLGEAADAGSRSGLPNYVTIAPGAFSQSALGPGFLGPKYAATSVAAATPAAASGFAELRVDYLRAASPLSKSRHDARLRLWRSMEEDFLRTRATDNVLAHDAVYEAAIAMLNSDAKNAFDMSEEPADVRDRYGRGSFGQGCLMARRLIERGVPFVEVAFGDGLGWDTHADNFTQVRRLSEQLDAGWATLMSELRERGLLERTTILWAGEFGRTPAINRNSGRDHFPQAFTTVLAGGGIAGGQVWGKTSDDGMEVVDGRMNQQDLLSTLCQALGIPPSTQNIADGGRPIAIAEGEIVKAVLT